RLAMVNVTNRADVNMGLRTFKLTLCHRRCSLCSRTDQAPAQKPSGFRASIYAKTERRTARR
ncbi:hypothetical protein ABC425_15150, partial [Brucella melitensis]|uniref:hypothetical protein n=1 Tax=Brucella melitensis TaxID=29459 RepID=UPI0031FBB459